MNKQMRAMPLGYGFFSFRIADFGLRIGEGIEHGAWSMGHREKFFLIQLLTLCSLLFALCRFSLTPETSRFRAPGESWLLTMLAVFDFLSGSVLARVVLIVAG